MRVRTTARRGPLTLLAVLGLLAIVVGVRVAVSAAGGGDDARGPLIGVVTASARGDGRTDILLADQLSVQLVREELDWSTIERRRGVYDWRTVDRTFLVAANRGIRVLPMLLTTPRWVSPQQKRLPDDLHAWGTFVAAVVGRYGEQGSFWRRHRELDAGRLVPPAFELWNEPYFRAYSDGGVSPERYARVFRAGAEAGKRVDPDARFLVAADNRYFTDAGEQRSWVDDMLTAEPTLGRLIGGVAAHPYAEGAPWDRQASPLQRTSRVAELLQQFRDHGVEAGAWITELGWSACLGAPRCVGEPLQARYLKWTLDHPKQAFGTDVDAILVFGLTSHMIKDGDVAEGDFGILRSDGSRRPAWTAVRQASVDAER